MFIRHHLAKGFNLIPLKNIRYTTEHTERMGAVAHIGWKILGEFGGETPKAGQSKHKYEIVFSPDEARDFRDRLNAMLQRFENETVQSALAGGTAVEVDDDEAEDVEEDA